MALFALFRRRKLERPAFALYGAAVAAARAPAWYTGLGVPDSLAGRFDLINLHVALLIRRLRRDPDPRGPALAQAVFDAMFADMDVNLREMGVGDLVVGKRVRRMWEAFHGRARAYEAALDADDAAALALALGRNIWGGHPPGMLGDLADLPARAMAAHAVAQDAVLAGQEFVSLLAGRVSFLAPAVPVDAV